MTYTEHSVLTNDALINLIYFVEETLNTKSLKLPIFCVSLILFFEMQKNGE